MIIPDRNKTLPFYLNQREREREGERERERVFVC